MSIGLFHRCKIVTIRMCSAEVVVPQTFMIDMYAAHVIVYIVI